MEEKKTIQLARMINDFFTFIQAKEEKKNEENIGNFLLLHRIYSKKMLMLVGMKMENFFFFFSFSPQ